MSTSERPVLVLGASGYIGRHVVAQLARLEIPHRRASREVGVDITDPATLAVLDDVSQVILLAGRTGTWASYEDPETFVTVNEIGLLNVLERLRRHNPTARVVFPSTRLVYRGDERPLREDAATGPRTVYAASKLMGEQLLRMYREVFGLRSTVVRISVPYGNDQDGPQSFGTLRHFLVAARTGGPLRVFGTGAQRRSFIHIGDLARMLVAVGLDPRADGETYNLGGPDDLSVAEVAALVAGRFGVEVETTPWPELHERIESGSTVFDSSRLLATFGLDYQHDLRSWIDTLDLEAA